MRKLIVHEFVTLDGVMQAPGGKDEDRDGGFAHGGWTVPRWHDDIGNTFTTLERPTWRNTTIIRGDVIESVRALKAERGAAYDLRLEVLEIIPERRGGPPLRTRLGMRGARLG